MASAGLRDDDGCIHATSRKALNTRRLQKQTSSMQAIPSRRSNGVVLDQLRPQLLRPSIPSSSRGIDGGPRRSTELVVWSRSRARERIFEAMKTMTLTCPHCGRAGSSKQTIPPGTKATARCPGCGLNFSISGPPVPIPVPVPAPVATPPERTLYEKHPAMFRNHPIGFCFCILITVMMATTAFSSHEPVAIWLALIGPVFLLAWWMEVLATTLKITSSRTILTRGVLSRETTEVFHEDIRNIQLKQSLCQRLFDVGYLGVSSSGQSGIEIEVVGMPTPMKVKEMLQSLSRSMRHTH